MLSKIASFAKPTLMAKPLFKPQFTAAPMMNFAQGRKAQKQQPRNEEREAGEDINIEQQKMSYGNARQSSGAQFDPIRPAEARNDNAGLKSDIPKMAGASTEDPNAEIGEMRRTKLSGSDKVLDDQIQNAETRRDSASMTGKVKTQKKDKMGSPEFEQKQTSYRGHPDNAEISSGQPGMPSRGFTDFNPLNAGGSFTSKSESFKIKAGNASADEQKVSQTHSKNKGFNSPDNESGMGLMSSLNPQNADKQKPSLNDTNFANKETERKLKDLGQAEPKVGLGEFEFKTDSTTKNKKQN